MKTKLTTDQFAEFMAKIIFKIDFYQYDVLHDISKIMKEQPVTLCIIIPHHKDI